MNHEDATNAGLEERPGALYPFSYRLKGQING
jgi:hypothetical protein